MSASGDPEHLVVGHLTKAHGTRGELLVKVLSDAPAEVLGEGHPVIVGDRQGGLDQALELKVEASRAYRKGWLVKFAGISDRARAEELAGRYLLTPRAERGELAEGEFYYHQLLQLYVETVDGRAVGRVREVYETEPHHMLEIKGPDGVHLLPLRRPWVVSVEVEEGRLVIDPPEGLLDL